MEIAEFLLARIAEDERRAAAAAMEVPQQRSDGEVWGVWLGNKWYQSSAFAAHAAMHSPARVLVECDVRRRIVESRAAIATPSREIHDEVAHQRDFVFRCLALPYAEHPDYQPEWKV